MNKLYGNLDFKINYTTVFVGIPRKSDRATNLKKERGKKRK